MSRHSCTVLRTSVPDVKQPLMMLQAVTEQLWDVAIIAYQKMNQPEGLYEAWSWMKEQGHDWMPSQHPAYTALVLAVTATHSNPLQGDLHFLHVSHCLMLHYATTRADTLKKQIQPVLVYKTVKCKS